MAATKSPGAELVGSWRVEIGDQDQFSKYYYQALYFLFYNLIWKVFLN